MFHFWQEIKYGTCSRKPPTKETVNTMEDVCRTVHQFVRQPLGLHSHRLDNEAPHGHWLPRIMIIGRKGSGRKTQAVMLAKELGLIFGELLLRNLVPFLIIFIINLLIGSLLVLILYLPKNSKLNFFLIIHKTYIGNLSQISCS